MKWFLLVVFASVLGWVVEAYADPPQQARRRRRPRTAYALATPAPLVAMPGKIGSVPRHAAIEVRNPARSRVGPCHLEVRVDGHPVVFVADNDMTATLIPPGEELEVALPLTGEALHQVDFACYPEVCGMVGGTFACDAAPRAALRGRVDLRGGDRITPGEVGSSWNLTDRL